MAFSGSLHLVPGPFICAQGVLLRESLHKSISSASGSFSLVASYSITTVSPFGIVPMTIISPKLGYSMGYLMISVPPGRQAALPARSVQVPLAVRHSPVSETLRRGGARLRAGPVGLVLLRFCQYDTYSITSLSNGSSLLHT